MSDLLELALSAHGGLDRWKAVPSIEVALTISERLLKIKGFPEHLSTSVLVNLDHPHIVMQPYDGRGRCGVFSLERDG